MIKRLPLVFILFFLILSGCEEEIESPELDLELDYQPLGIGYFWIYDVEQTLYFGENDSETSRFFYKDRIRSSYLNAEREIVYILERTKSTDQTTWTKELEYTLISRDNSIIRTVNNESVIALVFPPEEGKIWNGKSYQAEGDDDFEIVLVGSSEIPGFENTPSLRVDQENLDDKVTVRDVRYEVFGKEVGLLEKYDEVVTYCSRNDCLGDQLIDGGSKTHLKLVEYGKD